MAPHNYTCIVQSIAGIYSIFPRRGAFGAAKYMKISPRRLRRREESKISARRLRRRKKSARHIFTALCRENNWFGKPCGALREEARPPYCIYYDASGTAHISRSMVFPWILPRVRTGIPKTMQNHWQNNDSTCASCTSRTLIKPCENEHFRWSVYGKGVPFSSAPGAAVFATGRRLLPSGETHISTAAPLWRPPRG